MTTFIPTKINAKASKTGKTYWEIETNMGNATCFDYPIVQKIEGMLGKPITDYDLETNEKGFINLRPAKKAFHQVTAEPKVIPASPIIEARASKDVTMNTSYAKDIFIELFKVKASGDLKIETKETSNLELMREAIALVKQAKTSFERTEIFEENKTTTV